ncbi:MAG: PP2C family protein-serine/threonine phosphatase [Cytophagales bacterium]|nr:PP2C family protein-serine/threonine phosphatase [Bernardetiaceae bacterium]MDW8204361.1 PP2C family protein-serine/threonine phosphatase [Cytophagales bacterium]
MEQASAEFKLQMKEMQLNALFETIQAINENASEEQLFRIYKLTLQASHYIKKLALYVHEEGRWECKAQYGVLTDFSQEPLPSSVLALRNAGELHLTEGYFSVFNYALPVRHKDTMLAYVLIDTAQDIKDLNFLATLSNIILVAIENKKLARKQAQQEAFQRQMNIAKEVQSLLFPKKLPYNERLQIVASYQPHHSVGGDYYDYIEIAKDKFMVCIADVSGKGVPAAILMSNFQAALRILVREGKSLPYIIQTLNELILENSRGENYITAFFMEYDFSTRTLTYVNAGHNPPFLFLNDGSIQHLQEGTTILGGFKKLPFLDIISIAELSNFLLFCFTDGFIETYNDKGEIFGVEQLAAFVKAHQHLDRKQLHSELLKYLNQFRGEQAYVDDITLLSCSVAANK